MILGSHRAAADLCSLEPGTHLCALEPDGPHLDVVADDAVAGDLAPWFVVVGYNFFILVAGTGYLLGVTQSKEYAEPEWYADLWLVIVWVTYFVLYLRTLARRLHAPGDGGTRFAVAPAHPAVPEQVDQLARVALAGDDHHLAHAGLQVGEDALGLVEAPDRVRRVVEPHIAHAERLDDEEATEANAIAVERHGLVEVARALGPPEGRTVLQPGRQCLARLVGPAEPEAVALAVEGDDAAPVALVTGSDNHGWGRAAPGWTAVPERRTFTASLISRRVTTRRNCRSTLAIRDAGSS